MNTTPAPYGALDYTPGELDRTAPERIWLQVDTEADNSERDQPWPGSDLVTWQDESMGGLEIEYVRADLTALPRQPAEAGGHIFPRLLKSMRQMDEMVRAERVEDGNAQDSSLSDLADEMDAQAEIEFDAACCNSTYPFNANQRLLRDGASAIRRLANGTAPTSAPVGVSLDVIRKAVEDASPRWGEAHDNPFLHKLSRREREWIAGRVFQALTQQPSVAPVGVEGLMQLAREWCLSWGEWAHDNDPDCKKETAAEAALRTALTAALAQQPAAVDEARDLIKELRAILENINQDDYGDSHISTSGSGLTLIDEYLAGQQQEKGNG